MSKLSVRMHHSVYKIQSKMTKSVKNLWNILFGKSQDPIKLLPKSVMENVLSYFRGNDLLKLSLINKKWYDFIASSPSCMSKIRIHITEYFLSEKRPFLSKDLMGILKTGRKYQHLSIACIEGYNSRTQQFSSVHKLLMASFKWKSVSLVKHYFNDEMDLVDFLGLVEPSVERLELRDVKIQEFVGACDPNFKFFKLKTLLLANVCNFIHREFFKNVTKLENYAVSTEDFLPPFVDHSEEVRERVHCIKKILLNNPSMLSLELFIDQADFDHMFIDRGFVDSTKFNLRALMFGNFKKAHNNFQIGNFARFLRLHAHSIEHIFFSCCLGNTILEVVINGMSNLKSLSIEQDRSNRMENALVNDLKLTPNQTIETLDIWTPSNQLVAAILKSLPNLKHLETGTINQNVLEVLAQHNQKIRSIRVDFFVPTTPIKLSILEHLRQLVIAVNCNYIFTNLVKANNEHTRFELIFLRSARHLKRKWDVNCTSF